jgi:hypothetical protein
LLKKSCPFFSFHSLVAIFALFSAKQNVLLFLCKIWLKDVKVIAGLRSVRPAISPTSFFFFHCFSFVLHHFAHFFSSAAKLLISRQKIVVFLVISCAQQVVIFVIPGNVGLRQHFVKKTTIFLSSNDPSVLCEEFSGLYLCFNSMVLIIFDFFLYDIKVKLLL